nr:hypothetical protein TetV2_00123 [Oceanusvirus sp.]
MEILLLPSADSLFGETPFLPPPGTGPVSALKRDIVRQPIRMVTMEELRPALGTANRAQVKSLALSLKKKRKKNFSAEASRQARLKGLIDWNEHVCSSCLHPWTVESPRDASMKTCRACRRCA